MRTRLGSALWVASVPVLARAQMAASETSSSDLARFSMALPYVSVVVFAALYGVLFKTLSRVGGSAERWLVGASLLALPLVAVYGLRLIVFMPGLYESPIRASAFFWSVVSGLLAVAWWLLKAKTHWLDGPNRAPPVRRSPQGEGAYSYFVEAETTSRPDASIPPPAPEVAATTPAAAAPVPPPPVPTRDTVFISYRRQDSADVTGRIYDRLVQRFAREQIFKDVDSIPLGVDFRSHLEGVVGRCTLLLAVIGPAWLGAAGAKGRRLDDPSDFVRIEIEAALARGIPVIPILVGGATPPDANELPPGLAALTFRNGISVRPDPDFHRDMDRLIAGLESHQRLPGNR
jgi:hypothetical protein